MKITVDGKRYDLASMLALDIQRSEICGVRVEEVYFGPRSHRVIVHTYSIWESGRNDGTVVGDCYDVIEPGDTLDNADHDWLQSMTDALRDCDVDARSMLDTVIDQHHPAVIS